MAALSYDQSLACLLAHEGGYSNYPDDPGGPTNFGITLADYRRYVKAGATAADVRAMSIDEAKAIYRHRYWDAQRCDDLPAGVDYVVFDYGDDGAGMDAETLAKLFDPFFTTKRGSGGSGLGGHILYNLATNVLQGSLRVESSPGQGLRYHLRFPRKTARPEPKVA